MWEPVGDFKIVRNQTQQKWGERNVFGNSRGEHPEGQTVLLLERNEIRKALKLLKTFL